MITGTPILYNLQTKSINISKLIVNSMGPTTERGLIKNSEVSLGTRWREDFNRGIWGSGGGAIIPLKLQFFHRFSKPCFYHGNMVTTVEIS